MTKRIMGSFDRVREERALAKEIFLLAGADAYRRNLMHLLVGLSRAQILAWYYREYPEIKRYVKRHIKAGTCVDGLRELRNVVAETWPQEARPEMPLLSGTFVENKPPGIKAEILPEERPAPRRLVCIKGQKPRPRGPKPVETDRVEREMRAYKDPEALVTMPKEALAKTFDTSRPTANKALERLHKK